MDHDRIALSDPDISRSELAAVESALQAPRLSAGSGVALFERRFADYLGRRYAVAVGSGTLGLLLVLRALNVKQDDEVVASPYSWHQIAHAIALAGAKPVFADIDYWSGSLAAEKVAPCVTPRTRAIVAGNTNGHPAAWQALRAVADTYGIPLIEDSTEAIGSTYLGKAVGSFGDVALFDFSQPMAITCGEGGMVVTDDPELARELRYGRSHGLADRTSLSVGSRVPMQTQMSDVTAALGMAQLDRIDAILARRKRIEDLYLEHVQTFEGIKPPYIAPEADNVHWMLYQVHLGTRFTRTTRNQIVEDMATAGIEAAAFCQPLHLQHHYATLGFKRGNFRIAERIADRSIALPFHAHLDDDAIGFIVQTAKDSSINVGAGSAIY